ncbi:MAG: hypothetical protein Q7R52_04230 [archaeon]|nr:hypothetical protein [archaeon]
MTLEGVPLCSDDMANLERNMTIQFPARDSGIRGKLKKRWFKEEYSFVFNETPGNINGRVVIEPIYPADKIPQNAKNYHLLRLLDNTYTLS